MEGKKTYRTAARRQIADYLDKNADRGLTVGDIMKHLQKNDADVNVSTVYRYLGKLSEEGLVNKYTADSGEMALYQFAGPMRNCENHLHMQCVECGRVIHLDCEFMEEFSEHILEHHGFLIICKGSILYGTCENCRKDAKEE